MAKRKSRKRVTPTQRWKAEHPFVRKAYSSLDEVREAWIQYQELPDFTDRRIYYVSFDYRGEQEQLYCIARHKIEVYEILCLAHFGVHSQALQARDGGDPRPRLEYELSILHVHIEETKNFLRMMDDMPSDDARYQELRQQVENKLKKQEAVLVEKTKHLMHLKELSKAKAIEEHHEHQVEKQSGKHKLPVPDTHRVFVAPERPPLIIQDAPLGLCGPTIPFVQDSLGGSVIEQGIKRGPGPLPKKVYAQGEVADVSQSNDVAG